MKKSALSLLLIVIGITITSAQSNTQQPSHFNCKKDCTNLNKIDCSEMKNCQSKCKKEPSPNVQTYLVKAKDICDHFTNKDKNTAPKK